MTKKKDLSREDVKVWEEYTKNPTDVYDKERGLKISNRNKRFKFDLHGFTLDEANLKVKESSVEKYEKIKDNLFATVKFAAEVISVKKDKDNKIIEGNPDKIKFVTDSWKFTKNINNKSPNWYLSEIISQ